jgi:hypothetical protein
MKWPTRFPNIHYRVEVPWSDLEENIDRYVAQYGLNLTPDFQRGHVWSEAQQISFVEFAIRVPQSGMELYTNHPGWMTSFEGEFVLVDGKQRLHAALRFIRGEIPAYGHLVSEYDEFKYNDGTLKIPYDIAFHFNVAKLKTRADVLQWYIDFNVGGTPHAADEIARVKRLLEEENKGVK